MRLGKLVVVGREFLVQLDELVVLVLQLGEDELVVRSERIGMGGYSLPQQVTPQASAAQVTPKDILRDRLYAGASGGYIDVQEFAMESVHSPSRG